MTREISMKKRGESTADLWRSGSEWLAENASSGLPPPNGTPSRPKWPWVVVGAVLGFFVGGPIAALLGAAIAWGVVTAHREPSRKPGSKVRLEGNTRRHVQIVVTVCAAIALPMILITAFNEPSKGGGRSSDYYERRESESRKIERGIRQSGGYAVGGQQAAGLVAQSIESAANGGARCQVQSNAKAVLCIVNAMPSEADLMAQGIVHSMLTQDADLNGWRLTLVTPDDYVVTRNF